MTAASKQFYSKPMVEKCKIPVLYLDKCLDRMVSGSRR